MVVNSSRVSRHIVLVVLASVASSYLLVLGGTTTARVILLIGFLGGFFGWLPGRQDWLLGAGPTGR